MARVGDVDSGEGPACGALGHLRGVQPGERGRSVERAACHQHHCLRHGARHGLRRVVRPRTDPAIHSITSTPRELFYWLAIPVTFALGTASGDWILELTGWGPDTSVLLPQALSLPPHVGWRLAANAVLSFWLTYILTLRTR